MWRLATRLDNADLNKLRVHSFHLLCGADALLFLFLRRHVCVAVAVVVAVVVVAIVTVA